MALHATEFTGDLCKWLISWTLLNSTIHDKKLEITLMYISHWHSQLVEEMLKNFMQPKDLDYNVVISTWRKEWNLRDETPLLDKMLDYILKLTDAGESFKRNFILYMVSCFFNGSKNPHFASYFAKNAANVEEILAIDWCQCTIDKLCESVKKKASNFGNLILFLMVTFLVFY
ncbi:LOW QUALITY PROTEIN: hypothetical protein Cgig2_024260 [Carnegiea gigantea]|uniref:Uncharacterized protein n=1 Tax=Carnegiea gigantea TaxID=171969 RepID=A0A9Q1JF99_9CARY|nr:LOW QUALITY PROTEIN: hypothetical protein Cgig2_024260 [Carnegiea gigantea]